MRKHLFYCLMCLAVLLRAQNETDNWYFGNLAGISFSVNPPVPLTGGALSTNEGCSSISDATGSLLFYTDGITVYDRTHAIMANGTGLLGLVNPAQSSVIIKQPGSSTIYHIFTVRGNIGTEGFRYSTVDMSLAAGMGSVTVKNATLLAAPCTEFLSATRHCNGTDFWVMHHPRGSNNFRAHLVTAAGVNTVPVISSIGTIHTGSIMYTGMKFSPNGNKLATALGPNTSSVPNVEIFDFDNLTGTLSNSLSLCTNMPLAYSVEFSPDGSKLYASQGQIQQIPLNKICQWDLCAGSDAAVVASQTTVATFTSLAGGIQLGKNGKIYVARYDRNFLAVINNPNVYGSGCGFVDGALSIGTNSCMLGLPNFVSNYFREPYVPPTFGPFPVTQSGCGVAAFSGPTLPGCSAIAYHINGYSWNFGDPVSGTANTSTLSNPSHTYASVGTYSVRLIITTDCINDTLIQAVTISNSAPALTLTPSPSVIVCAGQTLALTASGASTYSWSNGGTGPILTLAPTSNTSYVVSTASGTCSIEKTVFVSVNPCVGISELPLAAWTRVYPNPAKNQITLDAEREGQLFLYNSVGKLMHELPLKTGHQSMDIENLSQGIYLLKFQYNEGYSWMKLVKE